MNDLRMNANRFRPVQCQWFLNCTRPAMYNVFHPVLGFVPVCQTCKEMIDAEK
jgi:predicted GNAT superfamily acetyltransferase